MKIKTPSVKEVKELIVKPVIEITNDGVRETVATFTFVFASAAFMYLTSSRILSIHRQTFYIFLGLFYGASLLLFKADMNPAISLARWVRGTIPFLNLLARWGAQLGAAIFAFFVVRMMGAREIDLMYWVVGGTTAIDIILMEGFFISIIVILSYSKYKSSYKPLAISASYVLILILFGSIIDAKLNFLFVIAPSIVFNHWSWVIPFFMLAHLMAIVIMTLFWIKDSFED